VTSSWEHGFTPKILQVLSSHFEVKADAIFEASPLIGYLNRKTRSAERGSKARGAFANLYAIYVLVEDYIEKGFAESGTYKAYEGAQFTQLFRRQRELPFGGKLQNHALNHRLNEEFRKFYPETVPPIIRDAETSRYWFNEQLLLVNLDDGTVNIAEPVKEIIDSYVVAKMQAFDEFIADCERLRDVAGEEPDQIHTFVDGLLRPNVDARLFEIVSFAILKSAYGAQAIVWGWTVDSLEEEALALYKTGRTNANDGGIDFVMKPLGRFFQVTEDLNMTKYFLDIDKVHRYPITFVVKTEANADQVRKEIEAQARRQFGVDHIVVRYMEAIEEIINLPALREEFKAACSQGQASEIMDELILQSRVEFNYPVPTVDDVDEVEGA
jgi:hypothetical protein